MKTNFFENIAKLNTPGNWKLTIHCDETGQMTVSALFNITANGDNAHKVVPPMLLKGTAAELDEVFFEVIEKPVQETAGLYHNMEQYLKGLEEAKKQSKMEQDKKAEALKAKNAKPKTSADADDIEITEPKVNKEEKKKAYDEAMKKIAELKGLTKYEEALELLPTATDYPEKEAELNLKAEDLNRLKAQKEKQMQFFNA